MDEEASKILSALDTRILGTFKRGPDEPPYYGAPVYWTIWSRKMDLFEIRTTEPEELIVARDSLAMSIAVLKFIARDLRHAGHPNVAESAKALAGRLKGNDLDVAGALEQLAKAIEEVKPRHPTPTKDDVFFYNKVPFLVGEVRGIKTALEKGEIHSHQDNVPHPEARNQERQHAEGLVTQIREVLQDNVDQARHLYTDTRAIISKGLSPDELQQLKTDISNARTDGRPEARQQVSEVLREVFPEPVRIVMEEFRALLAPVRLGVLFGKTALTVAVYQLLDTFGMETPLEEAKVGFDEQMTEFLASLEHLNQLLTPTPTTEEGNLVMSYYGEGIPNPASAATDIIALGHRSELRHVLLVVASPDEVEAFRSTLDHLLREKTGRTLSSFKNFSIRVFSSLRHLLQKVHTLVSKANAPAALVAQDVEAVEKARYRRNLLRVSVEDPADHTVALLLAAERLKKLTIDIITRGVQRAKDMIVGEWARIADELRRLRAFLVAA